MMYFYTTVYKPVRSAASIKRKLWAPALTIYALLTQLTVHVYTPWNGWSYESLDYMRLTCLGVGYGWRHDDGLSVNYEGHLAVQEVGGRLSEGGGSPARVRYAQVHNQTPQPR